MVRLIEISRHWSKYLYDFDLSIHNMDIHFHLLLAISSCMTVHVYDAILYGINYANS